MYRNFLLRFLTRLVEVDPKALLDQMEEIHVDIIHFTVVVEINI